jgi:hypothetical protein
MSAMSADGAAAAAAPQAPPAADPSAASASAAASAAAAAPQAPPPVAAAATKKQYQAVGIPTPEQIMQEEFMNNCGTRTVVAGVMGACLAACISVAAAPRARVLRGSCARRWTCGGV